MAQWKACRKLKEKKFFNWSKREIQKKKSKFMACSQAMLRKKIIVLYVHFIKEESSQMNNLSFYLKWLGKEIQNELKGSRKKRVIKNRNQFNWKQKSSRKSQ